MATPTTYSFVKTPIAIDRLTQEIQKSTIVTALDSMTYTGSNLDILFKDVLISGDQTTLGTLVTNHGGTSLALPPDVVTVLSIPAFAAKTLGTKSLFKRVVGIKATLAIGNNTVLYTETFPWVKFIGIEFFGSELGDSASLYVLDSATGQLTGVANYQLNQFGFTANLAKDFYVQKSEFDADLYAGLQIKILYNSMTAKTVGINFVMNEVK